MTSDRRPLDPEEPDENLKLTTHDETDLYQAVQSQGSEIKKMSYSGPGGHAEESYINLAYLPLLHLLIFITYHVQRATGRSAAELRLSVVDGLIVVRFQCAHNRLQQLNRRFRVPFPPCQEVH